MGLYPDAIIYLEAGLKGTKDKVLKYRLHFLLAQLYQITKDYDKARFHYRYVAKSNAPYEFAFQSNISIVKVNSLAGKTDTRESRKNLKRMLQKIAMMLLNESMNVLLILLFSILLLKQAS